MEFTNMDFKFSYPDQKFELNVETNKTVNGKFVECDLMSKRTPKCARFECNNLG